MVKKVVEKAGQNFQQQYQNSQPDANSDEVIFNNTKTSKPRETKKVGEYVDFEEVE